MGSKPTRSRQVPKLKTSEIQEFSKQTLFSNDKIENLYTHFYTISTSKVDDGVIDFVEFCSALRLPSASYLSERVFQLFDANHDGVINFREFLLGISTFVVCYDTQVNSSESYLITATKTQEQIEVSFRLFDMQCNGKIYTDDFKKLLKSAVRDNISTTFTEAQFDHIVRTTFLEAEAGSDEKGSFIDKEGYKNLVLKNPDMLRWLSVDLERVAHGARMLLQTAKKSKARCFTM